MLYSNSRSCIRCHCTHCWCSTCGCAGCAVHCADDVKMIIGANYAPSPLESYSCHHQSSIDIYTTLTMDTLSGILASMPPDPRSLTAGGPPAALSQATPTSAGPAGATAQTGGFVQPGEGKAATTPAPAASNGTAPTAATGTGAHDTLSSWATGISSFLSGPSPESNAASAASVGAYGPGPIGISSLGGLNPALLGGMGAGGLASSPLVPRPGETIDPKTGKPHVAGLTRAELEAKREAEAATAKEGVSTASSVAGPGKALEDLGGKEQAARQLTGTVPVPAGECPPSTLRLYRRDPYLCGVP